ncbi:UNVERIFIED_CONTAM: hypothetical protein PYX00_002726 [Menopon gallinae]|uniref:Protein jim lovell n=1 Tax=Menopon gallinae TaxID=328185 RepID=A0AAW2HX64_9NEOP
MGSQHYSLRWNNHQNHILNAFDTLLQNETLVDVTLVCEETSVRAHKVVLSACSPYFQRIFSENPCKHPIIVLKDLRGWEVQAIVDFMYKGEISVVQDQLQNLIKAAESLQVRGLTHTKQFPTDKENCGFQTNPFSPSPSLSMYPGATRAFSTPIEKEALPLSPYSPIPPSNFETPFKMTTSLPHMSHITFSENPPHPDQRQREHDRDKDRGSPIPRRKQARPMRRSGELQGGPQDLSKNPSSPIGETRPSSHPGTPQTPPNAASGHARQENQSEPDSESQEREPMEMQHISEEFPMRPEPINLPHSHPPVSTLKHDPSIDNSNFLPIPSLSALSMTPPHVFSLDQQLGLFPGIENCRNPLINDIPDHRNENHIISKRKMGRPKGQHSAPRGGPPRSWTNAELTEALQHVWNKKMTTSQASRIFGIPYNSLLMYVRGKYGKSLKLEQLKKDCLGGPGGPLDLLGLGPNPGNNNNHPPGKPNSEEIGHGQRGSEHDLSLPPSFNPYTAANFYPDFGAPFPVPVSMIHLLPQSEKNRELFNQSEKARELFNQSEKARELFSQTEKARELLSQSEKAREMFHQSEKAREIFHQTEKARDIFHQSEKARELFNQAMQLPQDLSSPDSKEEDCRSLRCKSRDNNNGSSLEGSPVALKTEPQPQLIENGDEN